MINKINRETAKEMGIAFNDLLEDFIENSYQEHRRGSNFYTKSIVEINSEWHPNVPRELDGYWETNEYVWDDNYGYDKSDINELVRVERKQKVVYENYWVKIEN